MDERFFFKFAFLMGCARDGLDEAETAEAVDRLARALAGPGEKRALHPIVDAVGSILGGVGKWALPVAVGGAALTGGGIGYVAAKLREGSFDADAAKKQELIAAYNSFADEATQVGRNRRPPGSTVRIPLS